MPYMCDKRHAPDTLFFVAEEDFRLFKTDERPSVDEPVASTGSGKWHPAGRVAARWKEEYDNWWSEDASWRQGGGPRAAEPVAAAGGMEEVGNGWYCRTKKPSASYMQTVSGSLVDMVQLATKAHRNDCGNFMWLTWDGCTPKQKGRKSVPQHATTLVAVSHLGAGILAKAMEHMRAYHFDVELKKLLEKDKNFREEMGACFVYP